MIATDKERDAVAAMHAVLVTLRTMAHEKADHELMAKALDMAEYLPCLMLEDEDNTEIFHGTLQGLATLHPSFNWAVERFENAN